ncbi:MAG: AMP-binding protein [Chloroflexia bacterium]
MLELEQMEAAMLEELESTYGDLEFDIIGLLRQVAIETPNQAAILEIDRTSLTYQGLLTLAEKTVRTLNGLGLTRLSRVAIALPSTSETAAAYISAMAGMTIIPMGYALPVDEYERYLKHTRADALLVRQDMPSSAREAATRLGIPAIELIYSADGPVGVFAISAHDDLSSLEPQFAQPCDTAVVLPTSGTTTLPKLVPWSQRDLAIVTYFGFRIFHMVEEPPYSVFGIMPLHHASGFGPMMRSLIGKVGFVYVSGSKVNQIFRYLAHYRPANTLVVPAVLQALVDEAPFHKEEMARFQLKRIAVVSAALPEELLRKAQRIFGVEVHTLYSMTEMLAITSAIRSIDSPSYAPGFVGSSVQFCRVQATDEGGAPLSTGHPGEIRVLSPRAFRGYENNPEANAEVFHEGWFRTGDAGQFDSEGNLSGSRK